MTRIRQERVMRWGKIKYYDNKNLNMYGGINQEHKGTLMWEGSTQTLFMLSHTTITLPICG